MICGELHEASHGFTTNTPCHSSRLHETAKLLDVPVSHFFNEMRSKQYLGALFTFWVTFWVTFRPFSRARGQPHDSRVGVKRPSRAEAFTDNGIPLAVQFQCGLFAACAMPPRFL